MNKTGLFILGGSTYYTLLLLASLKSRGVSDGLSKITLFGRNTKRLNLIAEIGNSLLGSTTEIDISVDIKDCLNEEYGLIFNQIRFGGMTSRDRDEKVALQNNLAADETIGIVGVSNAIRAINGMTPYLEIIKRKRKPYRLVNFTNPCSILTQYMVEYYKLPAIGICDYPEMMKVKIGNALSIDPQALQLGYFGLNHFGVVYSVEHNGRELIGDVLQTELSFKPDCNVFFDNLLNVSWRFVYERNAVVKEQQRSINRAAQLLEFEKVMDDLLEHGERDPDAYFNILSKRNCDWFNLVVSPLFANLLEQENNPLIANIAARDPLNVGMPDCVMEGLCEGSLESFEKHDLPPGLVQSPEYSLIKIMKLCERQLLQGILTNNKKLIVSACLNNPMIQEKHKVLAYFETLSHNDELINSLFKCGASARGISHES